MTCIVVISLLVSLAVAVTVAYGLHGRRVDDHPVCRKCGFDLFGKPAEAVVCTECGVGLNRRRAIRVGNREKRRHVVAVAIPLLLACLGWDGWCGWMMSRGVEPDRYLPAWWMIRQAHSADAKVRDRALGELALRIAENRLTPPQEATLVDEALARQVDLKQNWLPAWGNLVEGAHDAGRLSDARWDRYLFQSITVRFEPLHAGSGPQRWRLCDPFVVTVRRGPDRTGMPKKLKWPEGFHVDLYSEEQAYIGGIAQVAQFWGRDDVYPPEIDGLMPVARMDDVAVAGEVRDFAVESKISDTQTLKEGPQEIRIKFFLHGAKARKGARSNASPPPERTLDMAFPVILLAMPMLKSDAALGPTVKKSLKLSKMAYVASTSWNPYPYVNFELACDAPPIALGFEIYIACRDTMTGKPIEAVNNSGSVCFPKDARTSARKVQCAFAACYNPGPPFSVVLRPHQAAAPIGTKEIWGETVEFKNALGGGDGMMH